MSSQGLSIEDLDDASNDLVDELLREARAQQLAVPAAPFGDESDASTADAASAAAADSAESEAGTGKLRIDDFELCAHLADGAYSAVEIGRRKASRRLYAVKCIDKGASRPESPTKKRKILMIFFFFFFFPSAPVRSAGAVRQDGGDLAREADFGRTVRTAWQTIGPPQPI